VLLRPSDFMPSTKNFGSGTRSARMVTTGDVLWFIHVDSPAALDNGG